MEFAVDQAFVSIINTNHVYVVRQCGADYGTDGRIHAGRITAGS
jgi:hypothetical protein